jgi:ankyrin repeat protein
VDSRDIDDNTALHFSSEFGHLSVIEYLVTKVNANTKLRNKYGHVPKDIALNAEVVALFE